MKMYKYIQIGWVMLILPGIGILLTAHFRFQCSPIDFFDNGPINLEKIYKPKRKFYYQTLGEF